MLRGSDIICSHHHGSCVQSEIISGCKDSLCNRKFNALEPVHDSLASAGETRRKWPKKRNLYVINEYFEAIFNAVLSSAARSGKGS